MSEIAESEFPALFAHGTRKDWGVGVLSGVRDGKRTYLFEGGEERIMGGGALDMMRKITPLSAEQQSTLARLTALVAKRQGLPDPSKAAGFQLLEQLAGLRRNFPAGFQDPAWQAERRAATIRGAAQAEAKEQLSLKALDALLKASQPDALWAVVTKVLLSTGWVPADQLKPVPTLGVGLLAGAVRELLYGSATLEQRVDRFGVAYETSFHRPPRWETVTALMAIVFPDDYVLVELASFRKQLKALGSNGALPQRPTGAGYSRCVNAARIVAGKLTEQGEVPQDLLDVHDFIRYTLKAAPIARRPKAAAKAPAAKKKPAKRAEASEDSSEESMSDAD
ncbi:MAG: hypothetical protein K0R38_2325 [Polyangiaceae bacterium]|jgi:hypothetical protein|nr:hypothetical protein [Polyangiaceae bacterium]